MGRYRNKELISKIINYPFSMKTNRIKFDIDVQNTLQFSNIWWITSDSKKCPLLLKRGSLLTKINLSTVCSRRIIKTEISTLNLALLAALGIQTRHTELDLKSDFSQNPPILRRGNPGWASFFVHQIKLHWPVALEKFLVQPFVLLYPPGIKINSPLFE
jgi:hypothetical protein